MTSAQPALRLPYHRWPVHGALPLPKRTGHGYIIRLDTSSTDH